MVGSVFIKQLMSLILSIVIFSTVFTVGFYADTDIEHTEGHLENIASDIENTKNELDENQNKIDKAEAEKENINKNIAEVNLKCNTLENEIKKLGKRISTLEEQYNELMESSKESVELYKKRLKSIYMSDDTLYLEILLGAKSFKDCLDKLDFLQTISSHDRSIVEAVEKDMSVISDAYNEIMVSKKELQAKQKELSKEQKKLKELLSRNETILKELNETHDALSCVLDESNAEMLRIEQEIEKYYEEQKKRLEEEKRKQEELEHQLQLEQERLENENFDTDADTDTDASVDTDTSTDTSIDVDTSIDENTDTDNIQVDPADKYVWPCPGFYYLSSEWNEDRGSYNHGAIDIAGYGIYGSAIVAAQSGIVFSTANYCTHDYGKYDSCGCGGGYGNYVMIDHGNGKSTVYAHMKSTAVAFNQYVEKGQIIGYVGSTGHSTGPHLHFETRLFNVKYNPMTEY